MAAVWVSQKDVKGAEIGANRLKLLRWFWCSVFGQQYENAPNSQAEKDFSELRRWMLDGSPPASVTEFQSNSLKLRNVRPRQRAIYRGTMALVLHNGAIDFHNRGRITPQLIADKRNPVDDHHIFPQAFLNDNNVSVSLRDCILNRTYIDRITNRRLSRRAPSDYFGEIREKHGKAAADDLLQSHLLPTGENSPLLTDDFEGFLGERENRILSLISNKTGSTFTSGADIGLRGTPQLIKASQTKIKVGNGRNKLTRRNRWDEQSFMTELNGKAGSKAVEVAKDLIAWARDFSDIIWSGVSGICTPTIESDNGRYPLFAIRSEGRVVIRFGRLCRRKAFLDKEVQLELLQRFNEVPGLHFEEEALKGKPGFAIELLADSLVRDKFKAAVKWVVDQVRPKNQVSEGN